VSASLARRLAALSGLALAATVALWWMGSTRLAIDSGQDASRSAADALQAVWLARGLALAVPSARSAALRGWHTGVAVAVGLIAPSWPLVVLAWCASAVSLEQVLLAELLLIAAGVALPLIGDGVRRVLPHEEFAELTATGVGTVLAAAIWFARGGWAFPLH
jgi:hypothetical protein